MPLIAVLVDAFTAARARTPAARPGSRRAATFGRTAGARSGSGSGERRGRGRSGAGGAAQPVANSADTSTSCGPSGAISTRSRSYQPPVPPSSIDAIRRPVRAS
jgi:hypothetical protein